MTDKTMGQKRGPGRPPRAERPKRVPLTGHRNILTVEGKNPNFHYTWIKDRSESGQRIWEVKRAGYEFVDSSEALEIGEQSIYSSENVGSIYRVPAGVGGEFLYLMKIPKKFFKEDRQTKEDALLEQEKDMFRTRNTQADDGQYGKVEAKRTKFPL